MICEAGEGEFVDIGEATVGPLVDVVHFRQIPRDVTAGCRAAAFEGVQDESLIAGGDALGSA